MGSRNSRSCSHLTLVLWTTQLLLPLSFDSSLNVLVDCRCSLHLILTYIPESKTCWPQCPADYLGLLFNSLKDAFWTDRVLVLLNEISLKLLGCILKHWLCTSLEWLRSSPETSVKLIYFRLGLWVRCVECYPRVLRVTVQTSDSLPMSGNVLCHKWTWTLVADENLRSTHLASIAANFNYCVYVFCEQFT